jgi:hypothetical protein
MNRNVIALALGLLVGPALAGETGTLNRRPSLCRRPWWRHERSALATAARDL